LSAALGRNIASLPIPSSSGRAAPRGCMIGFAIVGPRSTPARGSSTGSRREH
jgi:hypothetical protein